MKNLLPPDPDPGMIFEIIPGVFYQYDQMLRSWVEVTATELSSGLATPARDGVMSAADLRKLNRLVLPPPSCTITSEQCDTVFGTGTLSLRSLDQIVRVSGYRALTYQDGADTVSRDFPFHLHQHTFGFDFGLSIEHLIAELKTRGQFNLAGNRGQKGPKGPTGPPGTQQLLVGPAGDPGAAGDSLPCQLQVQREIYPAKSVSDLQRVIVSLSLEPDQTDPDRYQIVAQRQAVGIPNASAGVLSVQGDQSPWILAMGSAVGSQPIYYVDIDPLVDTIHQKFLTEVARLKSGFEAVVTMWLQKMSLLFDEQKLALCCALEFCQSRKANTESRQHIEAVAASSVGKGRTTIHDRSSSGSLEFPVSMDCNPSGFPDQTSTNIPPPPVAPPSLPPVLPPPVLPPPVAGGHLADGCWDCWISGTGAPASITITDRFGTTVLSKSAVGFTGCRQVQASQLPAICNPAAGTLQAPIFYRVSCGVITGPPLKEYLVLDVYYSGCTGGGTPKAGDPCPPTGSSTPGWVKVVSAVAGAAQLQVSSCLDDTYTFDVQAPPVYGSGRTTVTVKKAAAVTTPPSPTVYADATAESCLFGPHGPIAPVSLTIHDPKFGPLPLVRGTSGSLNKQVWTACRTVTVDGSNDPQNCSTQTPIQVPLRYDLYVDTAARYALQIRYPACASSANPGIPTNRTPGQVAQVDCTQLDGGVSNIWSGIAYKAFGTCTRPLELDFAIDLPHIYGAGANLGVQALPSFRVAESTLPVTVPPVTPPTVTPPISPPPAVVNCNSCLFAAGAPAVYVQDAGGSCSLSLQSDGTLAGFHRIPVRGTVDCVTTADAVAVPVVYSLSCVPSDPTLYRLLVRYPACKGKTVPLSKAPSGLPLDVDNIYTDWPTIVQGSFDFHSDCARPLSLDLQVDFPQLYGAATSLGLRDLAPPGGASPDVRLPINPALPPPVAAAASLAATCDYCLFPNNNGTGAALVDPPPPVAVRVTDSQGDIILHLKQTRLTLRTYEWVGCADRTIGGVVKRVCCHLSCVTLSSGQVTARSCPQLSYVWDVGTVTKVIDPYVVPTSGKPDCLPLTFAMNLFGAQQNVVAAGLRSGPLPDRDGSATCNDCLLPSSSDPVFVLDSALGLQRMTKVGDRWVACLLVPITKVNPLGVSVTDAVPVRHELSCRFGAIQLEVLWPIAGQWASSYGYAADEITNRDFSGSFGLLSKPNLTCASFDDTKLRSGEKLTARYDGCSNPRRYQFRSQGAPYIAHAVSAITVLELGADPVPGIAIEQSSSDLVPQHLPAARPPAGGLVLELSATEHAGSSEQAAQIELGPGRYTVTIQECCPHIGDLYHAPVRLQYLSGGVHKHLKLPDRGQYASLEQARQAYLGSVTHFEHDGGTVRAYLSMLTPGRVSGSVKITLTAVADDFCAMDWSKLAWLEKGWQKGKCCGAVVELDGQDWIVLLRSAGADLSCGGGEVQGSPCNARYGSPAFAWPTFDGHSFAQLPASGQVKFAPSPDLSAEAARALATGKYAGGRGNPSVITQVLFPVADE